MTLLRSVLGFKGHVKVSPGCGLEAGRASRLLSPTVCLDTAVSLWYSSGFLTGTSTPTHEFSYLLTVESGLMFLLTAHQTAVRAEGERACTSRGPRLAVGTVAPASLFQQMPVSPTEWPAAAQLKCPLAYRHFLSGMKM